MIELPSITLCYIDRSISSFFDDPITDFLLSSCKSLFMKPNVGFFLSSASTGYAPFNLRLNTSLSPGPEPLTTVL